MKKLWLVAVLALTMLVAVVACTPLASPEDTGDTSAATEDATEAHGATQEEAATEATDTTQAVEETEAEMTTHASAVTQAPEITEAPETVAADEETEAATEAKTEAETEAVTEAPKYTTLFASNVKNAALGDKLNVTDLAYFFQFFMTPDSASDVRANGNSMSYYLAPISEMHAFIDENYAYTVDIETGHDGQQSLTKAGALAFVRGIHKVYSEDVPEVDATHALFPIGNFCEHDGGGSMGGAGIYATVLCNAEGERTLYFIVKYYTDATQQHIGNEMFTIAGVDGDRLTFVDDGTTVAILVGGKKYATVQLSGETTHAKLIPSFDVADAPEAKFAQTAIVTLNDGSTKTIYNPLVAATSASQIGIASRGDEFPFSEVKVEKAEAVSVPETFEKPKADDEHIVGAPVTLFSAQNIHDRATFTANDPVHQGAYNNHCTSVMKNGYVTLTSHGDDPYVAVIPSGTLTKATKTLVVKYRTTSTNTTGQYFVGSGANPQGRGDIVDIPYTADGEWHLAIVDLTGLTALSGDANYLRFDFFKGNSANLSIDVQWIAFFETEEEASIYDQEMGNPAE